MRFSGPRPKASCNIFLEKSRETAREAVAICHCKCCHHKAHPVARERGEEVGKGWRCDVWNMANKSIYDFSAETLDGVTVPLGDFRGKVLLVVNVATF
uniref:Glutathione peroxidase n=1 Tax=Hippocampus comes TaxID=109280 RepID=A0A3Q2YID4_HIPCM